MQSALAVTRKVGLARVTRELVAKHADVAEGTVSHYFNTMNQMRTAVGKHALKKMDAQILAMMLSDPKFKSKLQDKHKEAALRYLQD